MPNLDPKIPRGYEGTAKVPFHSISLGTAPPLDNFVPAPWLPAVRLEQKKNWHFVLEGGTIVSAAYVQGTEDLGGTAVTRNWCVPANGGAVRAIAYTALDVGVTEDIDNLGAAVAVAGAAVATIAANQPIGWIESPYYGTFNVYGNWTPQLVTTILCDQFVEFPIKYATAQDGFVAGDFIMPSNTGYPIPYSGLLADIEQICGRVILRKPILTGANSPDRLDLAQTVRPFTLAGSGTSGVPEHLYSAKDSGGMATEYIQAQIACL